MRRLVLLVVAALAASGCTDSSPLNAGSPPSASPSAASGASLSRLLPPPATPPGATLIIGQSQGSALRQTGILVHYDWAFNGQPRSFDKRPVSWPAPLPASAGQAVIDLGTTIMPQIVEIRVYTQLGSDGIPRGTLSLLRCDPSQGSRSNCRFTRAQPPDRGDWQVAFSIPAEPGTRYLAASAIWPVPAELAKGNAASRHAFTAAWIFALD